jgi:tetratricopeptide (TPR) repeat protein
MTQLRTCVRGHHWQALADQSLASTALCPVCGAVAVDDTGPIDSLPADELPPRPQPLPGLAGERGSATPPAPESWPSIPDFEILGVLGRGGMGVVYQARQKSLDRTVALKMIPLSDRARPEEIARFRSDAEAAAHLQHPDFMQIYQVGEQDGRPYFVLEFAGGGSLAQHIAATPQPVRQAAELVERLARAMHYAHERGIVHRDLKPANILLTSDGMPRITDFGLAKRLDKEMGQTRTGVVMGTPSYMAPEQAEGRTKEITPRTDVYALGAILYELLTGRPPFLAETSLETVRQVVSEEPVAPARLRPNVPRDLETVCLKCLHKEPARRYASALDLAEDLRRFVVGEPVQARPTSLVERAWKWARRRPALAALLAVGTASAAALAVVMLLYNAQLQGERAEAQRARERAQANYEKAREAVDRFYTKVTETKLLNVPRLEALKRDLLQTAGQFYEELVRDRADDPDAVADLGRAYWRLGNITGETASKTEARELLEKALALQEKLARDHPETAEHQSNLAATCTSLGTLSQRLGETARAGSLLQQARALWEKLARNHPADPFYQHNLAASDHNLGYWCQNTGDMAAAEQALRRAVAVRERLVREHGDVDLYISALGQTQNTLGLVYYSTGQGDKARAAWQASVKIQQELTARQPQVAEYQKDLAWCLNNLGALDFGAGQFGRAETAWQQAAAVQEKLVRNYPDVFQYQSDLALSYNHLAALYYTTGQLAKGEGMFAKALPLQEKLVHDHPAVTTYQTELAGTYDNQAILFHAAGKVAQADASFGKALALSEQLVREHPEMLDLTIQLGSVSGNRANALRERGQKQAALAAYDRAFGPLHAALQRAPRHPALRQSVREAYAGRASTLGELGRFADALRDWDRALEFEAGPGRDALRLARLLAVVGQGDYERAVAEADAIARATTEGDRLYAAACVHARASAAAGEDTRLPSPEQARRAEQYTAHAVEYLARARKAGYFQTADKVQHLSKDDDLAALRARADFKQLVSDLVQQTGSKPR